MRTKKNKKKVYRLEPVKYSPEGALVQHDLGLLPADQKIRGSLEGYLVVSVPVTTSQARAEAIRQSLGAVSNKAIIVTHNIEFLRAVQIDG